MMRDIDLIREACLIDGDWVAADDGSTLRVTDPANGGLIASVPRMGAAETRRAIAAAEGALVGWAARPAKERSTMLRRWHDLMIEHQEALARLLTREQGKSLVEARGEIAYAASFLEWFAEEAKRVYGDVIPGHARDKRILVLKQPIGVVAAITPWNFPAAMITRKLGPALAAGCTAVVKPASETPLTAFALGILAELAGLPPGVINIVSGRSDAIGGELTSNPAVRKLSFTGSTEIGRKLLAQCAPTVKKTSMELGGNAPFIVFDDADVDAAVEGAVLSKFRNSGQTCVCTNRIYAQASIHDLFVEKLAARVAGLKVGPGLSEDTQLGPLINENALLKVEEHIADALAHGAVVRGGGNRHELGGCFFEPTIMTGVTQDMMVARDETFGPLAPVIRFDTEEEVIALANDSEVGLAGYFYAADLARVWRVAERLECGMIGINTGLISTEVAPFGGVKQSGLGREGSRYGIDDYVELKYLCMSV